MKKTLLTLAVFGLLATPAVLAGEMDFLSETGANRGFAKEIALQFVSDGPAPVRMPSPRDREDGPASFAGTDTTIQRGVGAIPNTAGGAFMTPRNQADQNIRQLIRKLG